jgi:iron complex outermembrane receptor protein
MDSLTGNPLLSNESGDYLYAPAWQIFNVESTSNEVGALGNFATGPVTHEWTLGYTRVEQNADIFFYTGFPFQGANLYQPVTLTHVSREGIEPNLNRYNETLLTSYAFADTLSFMDERVKLTLGARRQQVEVQNFNFVTGQPSGAGYDEDATTPVAGIVIKPGENVSLYASYIEGLSQGPSAPNDPTLTNPGEVFPPLESKQKEIGIKVDWGTLYGSVALYEFDKPSGVRVGNTFSVNGEQRHRGLELTLFGEPLPSVRLNAGLAWMDSELSNTGNPATEGNQGIGVPELQANLRGEWDTPFLTGLTLHARVVYTGEQYVNQANTQEVDDWVRTDVGARYQLAVGDKPVMLRATIENVFDESDWGVATAGYLHLGEARTLLVSATVDF